MSAVVSDVSSGSEGVMIVTCSFVEDVEVKVLVMCSVMVEVFLVGLNR